MTTRSGVRGQSTAEYAVLIAIVIAALVGMQTYVKRGLQAKYKDASDTLTQSVGEGDFSLQQLDQYEPYYASSSFNVNQTQNATESVQDGGAVQRTDILEKTERAQGGFQEQKADLAQDDTWR